MAWEKKGEYRLGMRGRKIGALIIQGISLNGKRRGRGREDEDEDDKEGKCFIWFLVDGGLKIG